MSLVLGRLITLVYVSMSKSGVDSPSSSSSAMLVAGGSKRRFRVCQLIFRPIVILTLTILTLLIVSIVQMSSSHFSLNLKVLLVRAAANFQATSSTDTITTTTAITTTSSTPDLTPHSLPSIGGGLGPDGDVKFNLYTIGVYGVLYPFLIGSLVPQLISMTEANRYLVYNVRPHVALSFFWAAVFAGACAQSFANNYLIYSYKTPNSFIYTNIFASSLLILFLIVYSRASSAFSNSNSISN